MEIRRKRAYDAPSETDGFRVLVDRLWPRGVSKEDLRIDAWEKDIAPSVELRRWFDHDAERWHEFSKRYREELETARTASSIESVIAAAANAQAITLVYAAKDVEHNHAIVLQSVFERLAIDRTAAQPPVSTARSKKDTRASGPR